MRAMEALKTFVELRLLSQIQEQDTLEGNGACQYDDYERGKIDAYREILEIMPLLKDENVKPLQVTCIKAGAYPWVKVGGTYSIVNADRFQYLIQVDDREVWISKEDTEHFNYQV